MSRLLFKDNQDWKGTLFTNEPEKITYNLRYVALVKLNAGPVKDPAGKALERLGCEKEKAKELLNWGERGKILIDLASKNFSKLIQ